MHILYFTTLREKSKHIFTKKSPLYTEGGEDSVPYLRKQHLNQGHCHDHAAKNDPVISEDFKIMFLNISY